MTTYIYEPLDYSKAQIRLLMFYPAPDYSDPIHVSLQEVILPWSWLSTSLQADLEATNLASEDSENEGPDFATLSYVWGSPDDPSEVIVESAPEGANTVSITRNLDVALRHLRCRITDPMEIWIDAICINQGSLEERSHQVAMMDSIYAFAKGTIVWLGPEDNDSRRAMELLKWLAKRVYYDVDIENGLKRCPDAPPREPDEGVLEDETQDLPFSEEDMHAIISFLERDWFTRLWIRQEIVLATQADVVCGTAIMDWSDLLEGGTCVCRKALSVSLPVELSERFHRMTPAVVNLFFKNRVPSSFEVLRRDYRGVKFTDPRDIIYGIKSLLILEDQQLGVRPDYTLQTADVFMDVCVRISQRQRFTYFLDCCELASISVPNLPSWVPDWSHPMMPMRPVVNPWSACGFLSANATYLGDRVLRVAGIQISEVESVQDLFDPTDKDIEHYWETGIEEVFRRVQGWYPGAFMDNLYDENQSLLDAYCRTLGKGTFAETWDSTYPSKREPSFDEAKVVLERVWSLDPHWSRPEDLTTDHSLSRVLRYFLQSTRGRCFLFTENNLMGLAPQGTQLGDMISIILGCENPIILRKDPTSSDEPSGTRWKVVGPAYVNGLMNGEAIYGTVPSHYRPVHYLPPEVDRGTRTQGRSFLDTRTNELKTDPAAMLVESGLQPSVWCRQPHRLEVSEAELRERGVGLCDFFLV